MSTHPLGSILVTSDAGDAVQGNAVVLDATVGTVLDDFAFIYARTGDRLTSGVIGIGKETSSSDGTIDAVNIYGSDLSLIASVTSGISGGNPQYSPVAGNTTDSIYIALTPFGAGIVSATLHQISSAGVQHPTMWILPTSTNPKANAMIGLAPSADNRWAYYSVNSDSTSEIRSFDLVNNVAGPTVVTLASSDGFVAPGNLLMLASGNLLVFTSTALGTAFEVRQYTTAGSLVKTYPLASDVANGDAPELFRALSNDEFWIRTFPDGSLHASVFSRYSLTTGSLLTTFTVQDLDGTGQVPSTCPAIVLGAQPSPPFVGTETDIPIVRVRQVGIPPLPGNVAQFLGRVEGQFAVGLGVPDDPTANPKVALKASGNNGSTFGTERLMGLGRTGSYYTRAYVPTIGGGPDMRFPVLNLRCSDNVNFTLTDLFVTREAGNG